MAARNFDVIVIGAGPGGYVAAIRAAQLGKNVAIVEREHLGGICLNWGCIPTKALLRSAEVFHLMHRAKEFGLKADGISYDLDAVVARSRGVAKQLSGGIGHLMKKNKITVVMGEAHLPAKGRVSVKTDKGVEELAAPAIILATGARARQLPGLEADGDLVWTYKHALQPKRMPKKLLVIGSGAIGIEFASFFNTLGADVTVCEVMDRVLPVEDAEISAFAKKAFVKQGMKILEKTTVKKLDRKPGVGVTAHIEQDGKTTTKEMVASIFEGMGTTLATLGNKNNEIGVPLTLLRLSDAHRFGVFELGANHKGEIAYTSGLVAPHAAVITNVGTAHLEGFGSRRGIAEAKGEIYGGLVSGGVAVVNHDDEFAGYWRELTSDRRQIAFSMSEPVEVHAANARMGTNHAWAFDLHVAGESAPVQLQLLGRHNVMNALAAAALAHAVGASLAAIVRGLESTRPFAGRLVTKSAGMAVVIDDTYNANPGSVKAAIDVLADLPGRRVLVLGDMGELGEATQSGHEEVGEYARMKKIDALYTVGQFGHFAANSFGTEARAFQDKQLLIEELEKELEGVVTLLVKGSRSARMEHVVNALTDKKES